MRVVWAENSTNEDGFQVEREKKQGKNWNGTTTVADVGANTTTITDTPGSGTFRYRVKAYSAAGPSGWTAWVQITP